MMIKFIFVIVYIVVGMPLCELLVDWLEYKCGVDTYVQSRCSNFREYRKYKKIHIGIKKGD